MRDKLLKIIQAYEELEKRLMDPAVVSDPKEYARLAKEHANQAELVARAREYLGALDDIEAAKEMLHEADADEKAMLQEDIAANEAKLPELEEDIKFLLIPADPTQRSTVRSWRFAPAWAATRRPSSRATSSRCTSASASIGGWKLVVLSSSPERGRRLQDHRVQGLRRQGLLRAQV